MDIKQLTYFISVFEHANLSHAANHLSVAQSAISHHIQNLEAELKTSLFTRKPRGMEPTAAGQRLYVHAKNILASLKAAELDILSESKEIAGDFAIALPYTVMKTIGVPLMKTILSRYPQIRLSIVEGLSGSNQTDLINANVDLALFYNPYRNRKITMELILQEEVLCIGKKSIISDSLSAITYDDLAKLPILLLRQGGSARALVDKSNLLARLEINAPLQLNSISGITDGLLAGLGCTIAPKIFVSEPLRNGSLHARSIINPEFSRSLYLGYRRNYASNRLFETIKTLVLSLIKDEIQNGIWDAKFVHKM